MVTAKAFSVLRPKRMLFLRGTGRLNKRSTMLTIMVTESSAIRGEGEVPVVPRRRELRVVGDLGPISRTCLKRTKSVFGVIRRVGPSVVTVNSSRSRSIGGLRTTLSGEKVSTGTVHIGSCVFKRLSDAYGVVGEVGRASFGSGAKRLSWLKKLLG